MGRSDFMMYMVHDLSLWPIIVLHGLLGIWTSIYR